MSKTVVGLFNSTTEAEEVKAKLEASGYDTGHISVHAQDNDNEETSSTTRSYDADNVRDNHTHEESIGQRIGDFFRNLVGGDEDVHHHYATGVNSGGALLTATVDDEDAGAVADILHQYGARDIDDSAEGTGQRRNEYGNAANRNGETTIPVVEEQLNVGKREVDRGGVRIYSHVVEKPAEADVTLRDERIDVTRRPVDRPATAEDFAGGNKSFELRATGEEAVVEKRGRVVEEIHLDKQSSNHTENIRDTVRKTEVEVENLTGKPPANGNSNNDRLTDREDYATTSRTGGGNSSDRV
jgi:uncharacterized protein (TIGR02271 family)